ncbi:MULTISPECIES: hypothetical protein [Sphingomonas]|uniref:Antibiotic biosynthesis monooxygenase n=1 Tax=Sphingomonas kyungheensis TaxID=1069987 RepID=A0ABU8H0V4_9SPHN|nr:hypothetical protein [Sphingomonas sp. RIT328]EZP57285.1 hypothetical protein BW41_00128 [Sphingomonas sp. RIT328]
MNLVAPAFATLAISRVMRPGHEQAFEPWADRCVAAAQAQPRFRCAVRLAQAGGLHHLLLQFGDRTALDAWTGQDGYRALSDEADDFSVGLDQSDAGTLLAFTLPSEAAARKWKTACVTWIGVVPTLLIVSAVIGWLLPGAPKVVQQILSSVILTAALTWLILPKVRGWSRFWMLQDERGQLLRNAE